MRSLFRSSSLTALTAAAAVAAMSFASYSSLAQSPAASVAPSTPTPAPPLPPVPTRPTPPPRTPESALIPSPKDTGRHQQFMFRKTEGEIGLLFLGDSITDFWTRTGEWSWLQLAPYKPADFGISGDRTEHVIWRINNGELDGITPKVVVIMIGTNNIGHFADEKPEWAAAGVKKIVELVHEKLPQTKVLLLGVFPRSALAADPMRQKVSAINAIISGLDDGKTTRYLDISKSFLDEKGDLPSTVMPDKLHPNAHGYDLWLQAMRPLLDEMMR